MSLSAPLYPLAMKMLWGRWDKERYSENKYGLNIKKYVCIVGRLWSVLTASQQHTIKYD
jgi:hypothetical protein